MFNRFVHHIPMLLLALFIVPLLSILISIQLNLTQKKEDAYTSTIALRLAEPIGNLIGNLSILTSFEHLIKNTDSDKQPNYTHILSSTVQNTHQTLKEIDQLINQFSTDSQLEKQQWDNVQTLIKNTLSDPESFTATVNPQGGKLVVAVEQYYKLIKQSIPHEHAENSESYIIHSITDMVTNIALAGNNAILDHHLPVNNRQSMDENSYLLKAEIGLQSIQLALNLAAQENTSIDVNYQIIQEDIKTHIDNLLASLVRINAIEFNPANVNILIEEMQQFNAIRHQLIQTAYSMEQSNLAQSMSNIEQTMYLLWIFGTFILAITLIVFRLNLKTLNTLNDQTNLHTSILDTAMEAIVIIDKQGRITLFNPAAEHIFGFSKEEALGSDVSILMPESKRSAHVKMISNLAPDDDHEVIGRNQIRLIAQHKDGHTFYIDLSLNKMTLDNDVYYLSTIRNVDTEVQAQKELEKHAKTVEQTALKLIQSKQEAENANRHKSNFLATMSHEIRTPMNGIVGLTDLLLTTNIDHKQKQHLETIQQSAESLVLIINDILDMSKIEAGMLELKPTEVNLRRVCEELTGLLSIGTNSEVELLLYVAPDVPQYLMVDGIRLRQVLLNLINNAMKFTHVGYIILQVSRAEDCHPTANEKEVHLTFRVSDTGIGISPEAQQVIMDPFIQADSSSTRNYGGTGLGLSISKNLLALMDSSIDIKSTMNEGSCFCFDLTLTTTRKGLLDDQTKVESKNKTALIAMRHPVMEAVWQTYLATAGWDCHCMIGVDEVEKLTPILANNTPIDLIIVDCLNQNSTLSSAINIKNLWPNELPMPPIIASAHYHKNDTKCPEWWDIFVGEIQKPIRLEQLLLLLNQIHEGSFTEHKVNLDRLAHEQFVASFNDPMPKKQLSHLNVLIAEDNEANKTYMFELLNHLNITCDIVENGMLALSAYQQHHDKYDLILMDMNMPIMDGIRATELIREYENNAHLEPVVIIALTANVLPEQLAQCRRAGMNDTLTKPVRMETIERALHYWSSHAEPLTYQQGEQFNAESNENEQIRPVNNKSETLNQESFDTFILVTKDKAITMLDAFMGKICTTLDEIELSIKNKNRETLALQAHTIKSNAAQIGAIKLSHMLARLEDGAKGEKWLNNQDLYTDIAEEYQQLRTIIDHWKHEQRMTEGNE